MTTLSRRNYQLWRIIIVKPFPFWPLVEPVIWRFLWSINFVRKDNCCRVVSMIDAFAQHVSTRIKEGFYFPYRDRCRFDHHQLLYLFNWSIKDIVARSGEERQSLDSIQTSISATTASLSTAQGDLKNLCLENTSLNQELDKATNTSLASISVIVLGNLCLLCISR